MDVTWFFTGPNFVGLLVGIGSGTLFTTAGAASAATHPPLHEDAVKRAHGPRCATTDRGGAQRAVELTCVSSLSLSLSPFARCDAPVVARVGRHGRRRLRADVRGERRGDPRALAQAARACRAAVCAAH